MSIPAATPDKRASRMLPVKALTITPVKADTSIIPSKAILMEPAISVMATPMAGKSRGVITLKTAKPNSGEKILLSSGSIECLLLFSFAYGNPVLPLA